MTDNEDQNAHESAGSSNSYVLLFGLFMLVGLVALAWIGSPPIVDMAGKQLPQLDLQPLLNTDQDMDNAKLEGKVALIHFWGTWCPPCQLEFPEFAQVANEFLDHPDVAIVSVSCSGGPEKDLVRLKESTSQFMSEYPPIPTYADTVAMTRQQLSMLTPSGSFGYPTTVLVGRDGTIIKSLEGYIPGKMEELGDVIRESL